jgi:hypothetical protein
MPSKKILNNVGDGWKQIGDMIKNTARNPENMMSMAKPKKVRPVAGPAEKFGRKYGTKAGRAVDKGVSAVTNKVKTTANRIKGRAMDIAGEASQRRYNAADMLKAGAAGAAGVGIGSSIADKINTKDAGTNGMGKLLSSWSEHKRQQRGY